MSTLCAPTSVLDWMLTLSRDPDTRVAFQADPDGYAAYYGCHDLSVVEVDDCQS
jgi:hypothetical protein